MAVPEEDFEALVRRHQAMVYRIAAGFFASRAVAEEIVQDVFLQCFKNLKAFDSAEHVKSWLRRVATHRCIDVIRTGASQKERQLDELPPDVGGTQSATGSTAFGGVTRTGGFPTGKAKDGRHPPLQRGS